MTDTGGEQSNASAGQLGDEHHSPLIIATILREEGVTGVHTHVKQLRQFVRERHTSPEVVTPFSWYRALTVPVFGPRIVLKRCSDPASVVWYRLWHEVFLRKALRRRLRKVDSCVIYAQSPLAALAALRARRGGHQRVVLAIHLRVSEADEWADLKQIKRDGTVFRGIRRTERAVIPQVDGIVYVSEWARRALTGWLPEAAAVPSAVIGNFVAPREVIPGQATLGDLVTIGSLNPVKNHRYLLAVLAEARLAGRSLTLDIFGEGPCRKDLVQLARSLALDDLVRFRGFRSDVWEFLPRYRAYVHASHSESSSLAIIEAMAAGLPIVACNIGAIAELYDDGVEGRFWSLDEPSEAAATLLDLLDFEPVRAKAAAAAQARFRASFDAEVVGPRLCSFLLEKIGGHHVAEPSTPLGQKAQEVQQILGVGSHGRLRERT